ncbi:unnamed protein product [Parajaminaea phylloscopi]
MAAVNGRSHEGSFSGLLRRRLAGNRRGHRAEDAVKPGSGLGPGPLPEARTEEVPRSRLSAFLSPKPRETEALDALLTAPYPVPEAVTAFAEALKEDQGTQEPPQPHVAGASSAWTKLGLPSLRSPQPSSPRPPGESPSLADGAASAQSHGGQRQSTGPAPKKIGKIAAVSDFAPIRERMSKDGGRREGFVYSLLRWPLLIAIFAVIGLEFFAYVVTRQIVNVVEWMVAHRGKKGVIRRKMRKAHTFEDWTKTALELDGFMDHEKWKNQDASGMYDWILVKKVLHSLRTFREQGEDAELMAVLDLCCRNNFAGTESFRLYSETYYGTKKLIEDYLNEVERGLDHIISSESITLDQKRVFFRAVSKNLGRSGLCLSGGGAFGYYHIGLVKALLDAKLLPKIVAGTSAGGLIAALTCTRTDEELARLLVPELADRITACEEPITVWAKRAWQTGARFDPLQWAEKAAFFTMGSLTFKEAFERTGKTLNVSVIPSDRNSPVKLLNYLTAPRCVIWSALLASAAVPGLLPPVCLMQKTRHGEYVPWNWGHRFKDGSLRVDIPLQDLHSMFHVNYPIVSQVNPHVHLFFFAPTGNPGRPVAHRKGKGWRGGFLLSAAEHVLKLHLSVNFKIIRDLDLLPAILGTDWSGVFLQRFGGAVTIWPKTRFWDWIRILSDPDRAELSRMLKVGQQATWPKLHMIENRIRLERAVDRGRKFCRQELKASAALERKRQQNAEQDALQSRVSSADFSRGDLGGAHQDSGTDASIPRASGAGAAGAFASDTDGEAQRDYFTNIPRSRDGNAAKRLLGGFAGAMTPGTDGAMTPGSVAATPGELPLHSRLRSSNLEDDVELVDDADDEAPADAGPAIAMYAQGSTSTQDERRPQEALTAAALTPSHRRPSMASGSGGANGGSGGARPRRRASHQTLDNHQYSPAHTRDWSGGRGSIGPRSPWHNRGHGRDADADYRGGGSSDTSSSASEDV